MNINRVEFQLSDADLTTFEESGTLPDCVTRVVIAAFGERGGPIAVDLFRQYAQVSYEAFPSCVGHTYYGIEERIEEQNAAVTAHRLKVQAALSALVAKDASA